jgi:hypothetical protein
MQKKIHHQLAWPVHQSSIGLPLRIKDIPRVNHMKDGAGIVHHIKII